MITIRRTTLDDLNAITEIYNEAILTTDATFDSEPKTYAEQRRWFVNHGPRNPILVTEMNSIIVSQASLSEGAPHHTYIATAEVSLYVEEKALVKSFYKP